MKHKFIEKDFPPIQITIESQIEFDILINLIDEDVERIIKAKENKSPSNTWDDTTLALQDEFHFMGQMVYNY